VGAVTLAGVVHRAAAMTRWTLLFAGVVAACVPAPDAGGVDARPAPYHVAPDATPAPPDAAAEPGAPDAAPDSDGIDVLLVFGYAPSYIGELEGEMLAGALLADPRIDEVDALPLDNLAMMAPPGSTLAAYDVVVYWWNDGGEQWPSARIDHGNALADHVDAGGGVVTIGFAQGESALLGRILTAGYLPLRPGAGPATVTTTPATFEALAPDDPLLAGVSWMTAGLRPLAVVDPEAALVAAWSDGVPAVARKGAVVSLGLRLDPDDVGLAGHWQRLLANAVVVVAE
jgi:hypothetical protein